MHFSWTSFAVILVLAAPLPVLADDAGDKVDKGLDQAEKTYPVFVRMEDQLFRKGGDYEKFCKDHQNDRRSAVRKLVLQTLRDKSDRSWEKIKGRIEQLEAGGEVKSLVRFWIVNGFACEATGKVCRELAKEESVSFVYLQRGPVRQHLLTPAAAVPLSDDQRKILEKALKERQEEEEEFSSKGLEVPWNLKRIQADQAWDLEKTTGKGVVVAVADSGLLVAPPLLAALWKNPREEINGKDDDGNGYADDLFGYDFAGNSGFVLGDGPLPHGSACAGIIAGRPTREKPLVTGSAPRTRLMMLRGMGYLKSYEYALANGADILSMSYMWVNIELGHYRGLFRTAHEHLAAAGIVAVGGAGNFGVSSPKGKQIALPKDIPCVIAAAGIIEDGSQPAASSRGPCTWTGVRFYDDYPEDNPLPKPDVTGLFGGFPCWSRPSLVKAGGRFQLVWKGTDDSYGLLTGLQGNSFAGPHAAGVAALMLSANPDLNAWEVKDLIEATCKDLGEKGRDLSYGAGLLQALEAVRAAKKVKK
jgi:subtilisin family serine protease